jgi:hypothetical protein
MVYAALTSGKRGLMTSTRYELILTPDESKIAQLLTRDAWGYFSSLISSRELFHVKDIPLMPRRGTFSLPPDEELIQYYLDFAGAYAEELALYGWDERRAMGAANSFVEKLESVSGQVQGAMTARNGTIAVL